MKYISTRNKSIQCTSAEAIKNGLAPDGGLYVPEVIPTLTKEEIEKICDMSYPERVAYVLAKFLEDYTYEELLDYAEKAYSRFYGDDPCPLVNIDEGYYVLELWHGPTCAFKDMALTMLPHLLSAARRKTGAQGLYPPTRWGQPGSRSPTWRRSTTRPADSAGSSVPSATGAFMC